MVESNISRAERAVNALSDISFAEGQNEPVLVGEVTSTGH